jgi:predicted component of type VI protein secretion system
MSALETLREAMLTDLVETLNDKRNNLLVLPKNPECHCRNNIDYGLAQLRKSPNNTLSSFEAIETYVLKKKCQHTWCRKRMLDASWDVLSPAK